MTFKERKIELGRKYSLGVTWNGDVVRVYIDGVAVDSAIQPLPIRRAKVTKLNLGPYKDAYRGPRVWGDDVTVFRLRTWDVARTPAEVAAESGEVFSPLVETDKMTLVVPKLPAGVVAPAIDGHLDDAAWSHAGSVPQLIHGNFVGKSGQLPPHSFRLAYDDDAGEAARIVPRPDAAAQLREFPVRPVFVHRTGKEQQTLCRFLFCSGRKLQRRQDPSRTGPWTGRRSRLRCPL